VHVADSDSWTNRSLDFVAESSGARLVQVRDLIYTKLDRLSNRINTPCHSSNRLLIFKRLSTLAFGIPIL
jgi:hypothetical protein